MERKARLEWDRMKRVEDGDEVERISVKKSIEGDER